MFPPFSKVKQGLTLESTIDYVVDDYLNSQVSRRFEVFCWVLWFLIKTEGHEFDESRKNINSNWKTYHTLP